MNVAEAIDGVCAQALGLMHTEATLDGVEAAASIRRSLRAEIRGLRRALCVLQGWKPEAHCGQWERADRCIRNWHNLPGNNCPDPACVLKAFTEPRAVL